MKKSILVISGIVIIGGISLVLSKNNTTHLEKKQVEINKSKKNIILNKPEKNMTKIKIPSNSTPQLKIKSVKKKSLEHDVSEFNQTEKIKNKIIDKKIVLNKSKKNISKTNPLNNLPQIKNLNKIKNMDNLYNVKFTEIFQDDNLYIFIQTNLKHSLTKDKINKLVLNLKTNIKHGTIFVEENNHNDISIRVLPYKISIQKDSNQTPTFKNNQKYSFIEISNDNKNHIVIYMKKNKSIKKDTINNNVYVINKTLNYNFAFNSYEINNSKYINYIKNYFSSLKKSFPNKTPKIIINGYTDNIGSNSYNLNLSIKRALSLKQIIEPYGFDIECIGYGKTYPIASNDTDKGRSKNRRIEILFIK